jgi:hypothetical protein
MSTSRQKRIKQIIKGIDRQIANAETALSNPNLDGESKELIERIANLKVAKQKLLLACETAGENHSEQHR